MGFFKIFFIGCTGSILLLPTTIIKAASHQRSHSLSILANSLKQSVSTTIVKDQWYGNPAVPTLLTRVFNTSDVRQSWLHTFVPGLSFSSSRHFQSQMGVSFVCESDGGKGVFVELQVMQSPNSGGNLLSHENCLNSHIQKRIKVNISVTGEEEPQYLNDTSQQWIFLYKMQEQLRAEAVCLTNGPELIEYDAMKMPKLLSNRKLKDWMMFFRDAPHMTNSDVEEKIKTRSVLKAFDKANLEKMPIRIRAKYEDQEERRKHFDNLI